MNNLLSVKEVTEIFNVSRQALENWGRSGKLRGIKKGYRRLYYRKDVEQLQAKQHQLELEDQKIERTPEQEKFFVLLDMQLSGQESDLLKYSIISEREWHKFIIEMAEKYNVKIPVWFKKECRSWGVET